MKLLIIICTLAISSSSFAEQKIQKLLTNGEMRHDHITLLLDDGEIVHFYKVNTSLLEKVTKAYKNSSTIETVKISLNENSADLIADINIISTPPTRTVPTTTSNANHSARRNEYRTTSDVNNEDPRDPNSYGKISRLSSYDEAQKLMDKLNGDTHIDSQCYNRATMWTYETKLESKVNLGKIWIFFTEKYIKNYNYKWWFHIAPYANVNNDKYILDRGFTMIPYTVRNWKNIFMENNASCPVVKDYRQYENNQQTQDCYIIFSNQYYWQPYTLENLSKKGIIQRDYRQTNLEITYFNALQDKWDGIIPRPTQPDTDPVPDSPETLLKVNEGVISSNGVRGVVTKVYAGDIVVDVLFEGYSTALKQEVKDLAVLYGSSYGFRVGSKAYSKRTGKKGEVTGIYRDGRVAVKFKRDRHSIAMYVNQLIRY